MTADPADELQLTPGELLELAAVIQTCRLTARQTTLTARLIASAHLTVTATWAGLR
jgi:hypothetical protein